MVVSQHQSRPARLLVPCLFAVLLAPSGCGGDETSSSGCVTVTTDCTPLYEPTFDNIHTKTLVPSCALSGASCHSSQGQQGGLALDDPDIAYSGITSRINAADPGCSVLFERLSSSEPAMVMPPGKPLPASEQCAIAQWVQAGAVR